MCLMYIIRFIGCILFLLFPSLMSHYNPKPIIKNQLSTIVCYGDISSATICFFGLCLCVLCTRRVVLIDNKSCLEACLQAGFSGNLPGGPKVNRSRRLFALGRAKATVRFMSLAATSVSAVCRTRSSAPKAIKRVIWVFVYF